MMSVPSDIRFAWVPGRMAYRVKAGAVDHRPIPGDGLPIPHVEGARLLPGVEESTFAGWTLSRAAELLGRIAPWAEMWFAPAWEREGGRRCEGVMWAGTSWKGLGLAVVSSARSGRVTLPTVAHEAFHLWEPLMGGQPELWEAIMMAGTDWPDAYSASWSERGARAFAAYAAARLEGMSSPPGPPLFNDLWEGRLSPARPPSEIHLYNRARAAEGTSP